LGLDPERCSILGKERDERDARDDRGEGDFTGERAAENMNAMRRPPRRRRLIVERAHEEMQRQAVSGAGERRTEGCEEHEGRYAGGEGDDAEPEAGDRQQAAGEYSPPPFVIILPRNIFGSRPMTMDKPGPPVPLRRLLRTLDGVEMWHIEDARGGQRVPSIRYMVKSNGRESNFDRPHEAWHRFQQLTNAPEKDDRPEPPPLDSSLLTAKSGKTKRRRPRRTSGKASAILPS
jgi:hypothetical protein